VSTNAASIVTEQNTRASADSATAATIALLGAENGAQTAFILNEDTVKIASDGGDTLATRFSGLATADSTNAANITSEETARISGDNALSSSISTVSATVDGHTTSISTNASAIATTESDVTSLEAKYGVTLNVNGYITGFIQNNSGSSGEFVILADKFAVVDPSGDAGEPEYVPFQIVGGKVRFNANVEIDGNLMVSGTINGSSLINGTIGSTQIGANAITTTQLNADSVSTAKIQANAVTATEINVTNLAAMSADLGTITAGNITLNTSGYIKGGQTAYDTGSGFWLGYTGAKYKFSIGDGGSNSLTWDGTTLRVKGSLEVGTYTAADTETILSATTLRDTTAGTWVTQKEFDIAKSGTVRCVFTVSRGSGTVLNYPQYRVRENGSIVVGPYDITSTSDTVKTHDVTIANAGENVEIQMKSGTVDPSGAMLARVKNAYIKVQTQTGDLVVTD
jgi:hypothetical protein